MKGNKMFTREVVRGFRETLQFELNKLQQKLGVNISVGSASFTPNHVTFKVELAKTSADGQVLNKEAEDFKLYAHHWGLVPEDLGREFSYLGETYKIIGARPRSYKFPIVAQRRDGKVFKMPSLAVRFPKLNTI